MPPPWHTEHTPSPSFARILIDSQSGHCIALPPAELWIILFRIRPRPFAHSNAIYRTSNFSSALIQNMGLDYCCGLILVSPEFQGLSWHQTGKSFPQKTKRLPGRAPPGRASECLVRLRLCRRWARNCYAYPGSNSGPPAEALTIAQGRGRCQEFLQPPSSPRGRKPLRRFQLQTVCSGYWL